MDERGKEFVAKKNWDNWQYALFIGVIIALLAVMYITRTIAFMIAFLFVLVVLSLYYMWHTFKAEYAYTISGKLTVEILKSGGKRQSVCEVFLSDIVFAGKYNDEIKAKLENIDETIKAATDVKDDEETYAALVERNGKRTVILFTPNDMMIEELKKKVKFI